MKTNYPILILFAHPAYQRSRVNAKLAQAVSELKGVTFHDLYENYPDFAIDTKKEQQLLSEHDIIVLQFPFFWYSTPSIIKEWEDVVLEHGWAYGKGGTALHGKKLIAVISTGGGETVYKEGDTNFPLRKLLSPLERSALLCGMSFIPPFMIYGCHLLKEEDIARHAENYRHLIIAMRDGRFDFAKASKLENISGRPDGVIIKM